MPKNKKNVKIIAFSLVAVLAVSIFIGATTSSSSSSNGEDAAVEEEASRELIVDTLLPTIGDIRVTSEYIGKVEPNQQVMVIPKAQGEVLAVNYNVGDYVEAGAVLLEIDSSAQRNALAQAQAGYNLQVASNELQMEVAQRQKELYNENLATGYNVEVVKAEAAVEQAEIGVESATSTLHAARKTLRDTYDAYREDNYTVSNSDIERARQATVQAELGVENAQLALEQAKNGLEVALKNLEDGKEDLDDNIRAKELAADLSVTELQIQQMADTLSDYAVKAPISGIIEQRNIEPYGMASAANPVFVISNKDLMTISFSVPESSYAYINIGDPIVLEKNGSTYSGYITEISTMVDASGLFTIKAGVENPPSDLYTGASVKIYADTQKADNTVIIPISALYYDNGQPYVFVADNGLVRKAFVEVGIFDAEQAQILSGIGLDDQIISTWSSSLADGVEVTLAAGDSSTKPSGINEEEDTTEASASDDQGEDGEIDPPADEGEPA